MGVCAGKEGTEGRLSLCAPGPPTTVSVPAAALQPGTLLTPCSRSSHSAGRPACPTLSLPVPLRSLASSSPPFSPPPPCGDEKEEDSAEEEEADGGGGAPRDLGWAGARRGGLGTASVEL